VEHAGTAQVRRVHHFDMTAQPEPGRFLIREASAADIPTLLEFRLAMMVDISGGEIPAGYGELSRVNETWLREHFGRDFSALLAEFGGRPVASAGLMWFNHPPGIQNPGGREAYILNVYTKPEARRMGAARLLVEQLIAQAGAAGTRMIWLRASEAGRPLYESMGFGTGKYLQLKPEPTQAEGGDRG